MTAALTDFLSNYLRTGIAGYRTADFRRRPGNGWTDAPNAIATCIDTVWVPAAIVLASVLTFSVFWS